jgi:protein-S-isoprenylcysteine O-methyltransferase Ste14
MVAKLIVRTLIWFGLMGLVLFLAAGTLDWPSAWVFMVGMMIMSLTMGLRFARLDPALMEERLGSFVQKEQPRADKVLTVTLLLAIFAALALMGLDAVRFRWSSVPPWVQGVGAAILLLSLWISDRTMRANSFAAPVVKIQKERGQTVITTGPYRYVRHPLYAGALLYFVGMSLLLGSLWGLLSVPVFALLFGLRIPIEERAMRAGLQGYDDYARRVPYRLVPLIW